MYPPLDVFVVRALGDLTKWTKGMLGLLLPDTNTTRVILMQPGQRVCIKIAVVLGYRRGIMLGPADATLFRERTYKRLGLDVHPRQNESLSFPLRIKLFNRGGSRHIRVPSNQQLRELLLERGGTEMFQLEVVEELIELTFAQQVGVWANADLIIMPHGAGLTNMIFARNHVPIIEVFPRHFVNDLYRQEAQRTGHPYFPLMSERLNSSAFKDRPIDEINCEYYHGIDIMSQADCHHNYFKSSMVTLDPKKLMDTIEMALETLPLDSFPSSQSLSHPIRPANNPWGVPG